MADDTKDDVTTDESIDSDQEEKAEEGKVEDTKEETSDPESPESSSGSGEAKTEDEGYQFDDDLTSSETTAPATQGAKKGGGGYAQELFTKTIHAKFRTFYVDLKESVNGKFVKVSEKSRGRKSTIMMDAEDVPAMIEALQEVQKQL